MRIQKNIFVISCLLLFLLPATTFAATISLQATPANIGVGDIVRIDVLLNSAIATNAFSGTLSYSKTLEPTAISDGNSIINLWITHPIVHTAGAPITFAGITPGGFSGNGGILFSVLFRAKAVGAVNISLGNIEVLRNDGAGGNEPVVTKPLTLSIGPKPSGGYTEPADTTPPESFTSYLGTDPQLFGGQSYLVFMAVDKDSGVDHYAIAESQIPSFLLPLFPLSWEMATSPYVLVNQTRMSRIYVKAVDRAGNERLSIYPPRYFFTLYEDIVLLVILIAVVLFWKKNLWRRRPKKNS